MKAVFLFLVGVAIGATGPLDAQADTMLVKLEARARADSNDPLVLYDLAHAYMEAGRSDEARRTLETALQIDGEFAGGYAMLAHLEVMRSGLDGASLDSSPALRGRLKNAASPDSVTHLFRRAVLLDPLQDLDPPDGLEQPASWRSVWWDPLQDFWHGRFDRSATRLQAAITKADRKHRPPPPVALWYHALAESRLQHVDSSIVDLARLLTAAEQPSAPLAESGTQRVRYALAYLYQQTGQFAAAESLYQQAVERDLSLDLAHTQLARIYESTARWPEAIKERNAALQIDPTNPSLQYDMGVTLLEAGQLREAVDTLHRVIVLCPRNARAYYAIGLAFERAQLSQLARDAYERFLQLAPSRYTDMVADAKERLTHLPAQ